jgi:putative PEP-CTERM system TPR-repeat lipoprotein
MSLVPRFRHTLLARMCLLALVCSSAATGWAADSKASRFYEDALGRYEKKDMPGAIIQLKNALQVDKSMLPVQVLLGKALLSNGETAAAEVALAEALRLGVSRAELVVPLAQAYLAQGKHTLLLEQPMFAVAGLPPAVQVQLLVLRSSASLDLSDPRGALRALDDARAIDHRSADPWLAEVPVRIRGRQLKEAAEAVARAQQLAPDTAEVLYQRGAVAHVQGDAAAALAAYDQVLAKDARHGEARVARAGLYVDQNRIADAARDLVELKNYLPNEPRAAYLRALLAQREGKDSVAQAALRQVTELIDPAPPALVQYRPQLLLLNGLAHYTLGEREKAKPLLETLMRVQGPSAASKLLAQIYLQENNVERAASVLEAYLRLQPADGQAMVLLASAHMAQGRNARAITLMQEALRTSDSAEFRTVLGMGLLGSGQVGSATAELEAALRKDPAHTQAGVALSGLYMRRGQPARAVPIIESLVQRQPNSAGLHDLLGMALAQTGKVAAARAAFERAIALDGTLTAPKLHLARVEIAAKQFDAAAARLDAMRKADEKNIEVLLELSVLATQRGQAAETLRWLERADNVGGRQELRPGLGLVDAHLRAGRAAQAMEAARNLTPKAPNDLQVQLAYGRAQLAMGDAAGARASFNNAARVPGDNPALHVQIAGLNMAAGNTDGAAYSLERALALEPDHLLAQAIMADVELRRRDFPRAEERAGRIVAQHPKRAIGYSLLGDVAAARGRPGAAVDAYRKAYQAEPSTDTVLRLYRQLWSQDGGKSAAAVVEQWLKQQPQDVVARRALADGYAQSGQFAAARTGYEALLKSLPNDAGVLNNLANVLLRQKDPGAVAIAERAHAQAPADAAVIDTFGWALFQTGDPANYDRSLQLLRDARLREPGDPSIRYHLATVLAKAGRHQEARSEVQAALASGGFEYSDQASSLLKSLP